MVTNRGRRTAVGTGNRSRTRLVLFWTSCRSNLLWRRGFRPATLRRRDSFNVWVEEKTVEVQITSAYWTGHHCRTLQNPTRTHKAQTPQKNQNQSPNISVSMKTQTPQRRPTMDLDPQNRVRAPGSSLTCATQERHTTTAAQRHTTAACQRRRLSAAPKAQSDQSAARSTQE